MKSILLILVLFFSIASKAQSLDTVIVRNLQLQAQDWAWLVAEAPIYEDSVAATNFRRIRDKIRTDNPTDWITNITVDSLAGKVVLYFYRKTKTANAGEIVSRYTAIINAISSKTNLATWLSDFDAILSADYLRMRKAGKTIIMDN